MIRLLLIVAFLAPLGGAGKILLSRDEALLNAFPEATFRKETLWPSAELHKRAEEFAGVPIPEGPVHRWVAEKKGEVLGFIYFDRHRVRTLPETLMVGILPNGTLKGLEVLRFSEPINYMPGPRWYKQFDNRQLDEKLQLKKGISAVTGATLTARATVNSSRRTLALHKALSGQ